MASEPKTVTRKVSELVDDDSESPLPLSVIPNHMGINLCSVDALSWTRQPDGQLTQLTIHFTPASTESDGRARVVEHRPPRAQRVGVGDTAPPRPRLVGAPPPIPSLEAMDPESAGDAWAKAAQRSSVTMSRMLNQFVQADNVDDLVSFFRGFAKAQPAELRQTVVGGMLDMLESGAIAAGWKPEEQDRKAQFIRVMAAARVRLMGEQASS